MKIKLFLYPIVIFIGLSAYSQSTPPCGSDYGSSSDEINIVVQMRYGNIVDAVSAINQAKNTRGTSLGCPQILLTYSAPDITEPLLSDIENIWNTVHAPTISSYSVSCPRIGRYESNAALGAYYAMQAGYYNDTTKLAEIANMMYDQQYALWNTVSPDTRNEGVYGYVNVPTGNMCYIGGVVGESVDTLCSLLPLYCVDYTGGQFAGEKFAISSQDDANNWFDGGMSYDHGWVGIQMIESSIMQNDYNLKQKYRNSVELAGQYAISEYCVKNHNYTAKLIWLLSELYAWTGDPIYKSELNNKLDKNLLPGILYDANNDGFVDGTLPPVAFDSLTSIAQTPGRMWDGHNSLPWYHAMNTWSLTEAYVAFRDQGDTVRANELKPYVTAMLDNLANEIISKGVITPNSLGVRDISYALLTGVWKISQYENEVHLNWEQAAWAMWNSGYFNSYSTHSVCVGLYLLVKSGTSYQPLVDREDFLLSIDDDGELGLSARLYPNVSSNLLNVELVNSSQENKSYAIFDFQGRLVHKGTLIGEITSVNISGLSKGAYLFKIFENSKLFKTLKFIKT